MKGTFRVRTSMRTEDDQVYATSMVHISTEEDGESSEHIAIPAFRTLLLIPQAFLGTLTESDRHFALATTETDAFLHFKANRERLKLPLQKGSSFILR